MGVYESLEVDGANGEVTFTVSFFLLQWSDCRPGKSEVLPHCWHDWYALHVIHTQNIASYCTSGRVVFSQAEGE